MDQLHRKEPGALLSARSLLPLVCALLVGCGGGAGQDGPTPRHDDVVDVLHASAVAWNRGDLEGFLEPYENSARTSFAGRSAFIRGFDALRASYERGYWSSGAPADSLAFEVIEVRPLGEEAALLLGRYRLSDRRGGELTSTGIFSLVFVHTAGGWKITHDHTSETPLGPEQ